MSLVVAAVQKSGLVRQHHHLDLIAQLQLLEDVVDLGLDRGVSSRKWTRVTQRPRPSPLAEGPR